MSKIIFLCTPAYGHVNPTLPVVQGLILRGEEVIYYNDVEFKAQIEGAGATFRAYPQTQLTSAAIANAAKDGNVANTIVLHLQVTDDLLPFTIAELTREQPDLVVFDSLAMWGKMATTILKLPAASSITHFIFDFKTSGVSFLRILGMAKRYIPNVLPLVKARRRLIQNYGKDAFPSSEPLIPVRGGLNIVFTARELQPDVAIIDDTFCFVGPSITQRPANAVDLIGLPEAPFVYISLGTVHYTNVEFFKNCLEVFANYPSHFLLAVGKATEISRLGPIPPNFTVRNFVPQLEVLQRATAFITHGGMNSFHEGLYYGVPLVVIPHQFEQLLNARSVEAHGAAVVIESAYNGDQVNPAELRDSLEKVLTVPSYRESALALMQTLRATGGFRQAADEIQRYIAVTKSGQEVTD